MKLLLFLAFLFLTNLSYSQENNAAIDSFKYYDDGFWDILYKNPEKSRVMAFKSYQWALEVGVPTYLVSGMQNIANYYLTTQQIDSAKIYALKNYNYAQSEGLKKNIIDTRSVLSNIMYYQGKLDSAIYFVNLNIENSKENLDTSKTISFLNNKGAFLNSKGEFHEALGYYIEAEKLCIGKKYEEKKAISWVNQAMVYGGLEEFEESNRIFLKSLDVFEAAEMNTYLLSTLNNLGENYIRLNDFKNAEIYFKRAIDNSMGGTQVLGFANWGMSQVEQNKGNYDLSMKYAKASVEYDKKEGNPNKILTDYIQIARIYKYKKDYKKALNILKFTANKYVSEDVLSTKISYEEDIMDLELLALNRNDLSERLKELFTHKDTMFSNTKVEVTLDLKEKYKSEKKQIENERLLAQQKLKEATISKQNTLLWGGGLGLGLLGLLSFLLFRQSAKRKEANLVLSKQRDQIKLLNREINHRVKNNLAFMTSLLEMQGRRTDTIEAKQVLKESESRLKALSLVHSNLFKNEQDTEINLRSYLEEILSHLHNIFELPNKSLAIDYNFIDFTLDAEDAMRIGLIINELVTNSVKYAFVDVDKPEIKLETLLDNNKLVLRYKDNGPGIKEEILNQPSAKSTSMGRKLIDLLIRQLNATMNTEGNQLTIQLA